MTQTTDMKIRSIPFLLLASFFPSSLFCVAQEMSSSQLTSEQEKFFENKIRPALVKHCYKCHAEEGDKVKGGLLLDTRDASRSGGDSGPAVVPFDLRESLLYVAITYEDSSLEMPPKYKLEDEVIADFRKWIEMGAPDPRERIHPEGTPQEYTNTIDIEEGREHWAYQPPQSPVVPAAAEKDIPLSSIDAFLSKKRAEKGLTANEAADGYTLLRRLTFDLTGLPPTSEEIAQFVPAYEAHPESAIAEAVSRLLASPGFGERWGRRWLDVARYAESTGKEINATYPHAWRYRDYVIDAFQSDKPFDEFLMEQIAGDLLPSETPEELIENTVATGFLAIGVKGLNEQNARQFRFDLVDEQIDVTTRAFLGTTAACARCHDHKSDPIPMSDYYAMAGIFLSSETLFGTAEALQNRKATELISLPAPAEAGASSKSLAEMIDLEYQRDLVRERLADINTQIREARAEGNTDQAQRLRLQTLGLNNRAGLLDREIASFSDDGKAHPLAMGMADRPAPFDSQILIRGEEDNPTEERAPRGFLQVIPTPDQESIGPDESGRLQMAEWMASPENPLTARVFVNRVWSWMFGEGIVSSVDNFGPTGDQPSHPELLDYLALRFIELDWSVKDVVREIASSQAYRMSSDYNAAHFEKDPENRFLWRMSKRRLDAESIRDATLAVSGQLDTERPHASLVAELGDGFVGRNVSESQINTENRRRSVYLPIVRGLVPESLSLFDFADPNLIAGKREITTVPSQALYLMNSDFVIENAEAMAKHLFQDLDLRGSALIEEAFRRCYSRSPSPEEASKTRAYVERFIATASDSGMEAQQARALALTTFCQSLICSAEFRYLN
ncbi:MAG: PSD1 and planctomycete cytochrome C domain-containing protein [Verrucomicrobiales bacterium]|nr:PSD1 and planctomycete cytochrome C domain-containing protein [Verrucomicrobiales bacterium]